MRDFELTDARMLPFYDFFARNVTCWHYGRDLSLVEKIHMALVIAKALPTEELGLVTYEADAFQFRQVKRLLRRRPKGASPIVPKEAT